MLKLSHQNSGSFQLGKYLLAVWCGLILTVNIQVPIEDVIESAVRHFSHLDLLLLFLFTVVLWNEPRTNSSIFDCKITKKESFYSGNKSTCKLHYNRGTLLNNQIIQYIELIITMWTLIYRVKGWALGSWNSWVFYNKLKIKINLKLAYEN